MERTRRRRHGPGSGHQLRVTRGAEGVICAGAGCAATATTMCVLCARAYCRDHCRRASLFSVFRARTDLPEDLIDLLNSIDDPRARLWLCDQCESGVPIPDGRSWSLG